MSVASQSCNGTRPSASGRDAVSQLLTHSSPSSAILKHTADTVTDADTVAGEAATTHSVIHRYQGGLSTISILESSSGLGIHASPRSLYLHFTSTGAVVTVATGSTVEPTEPARNRYRSGSVRHRLSAELTARSPTYSAITSLTI